jgi:hypothetical protein
MPNHRFKPIQLGARTVSRYSLREGNYLTERLLLGLAANMSSNNARAPFTVLLVPSSFVQASPGAAVSLAHKNPLRTGNVLSESC